MADINTSDATAQAPAQAPTFTDAAGNPVQFTPEQQAEALQNLSPAPTTAATAAPPEAPQELLNPYKGMQLTDEAGKPAALTPAQQAEARKNAGVVDPLLDLSADDMFALARNPDNNFSILQAFRARQKEVAQDPGATRRVADAWAKYKASTGLGDLPSVSDMANNVWGFVSNAAKYAGGLVQSYPARIGAALGGTDGEMTPAEAEALQTQAERAAATGTALTGLGQQVGRLFEPNAGSPSIIPSPVISAGMNRVAGLFGIPEEKPSAPPNPVETLFRDSTKADQLQKATEGKLGGPIGDLPPETLAAMAKAGYPLRPDVVASLAQGDPLSLYLMGKAFGAAGEAIPTVIPKAALNSAGEAVATGAGGTISALSKGAQAVIPKVTPFLPPAFAAKGAATGAVSVGPITGAAIGWGAGKAAAKQLTSLAPTLEKLELAGQQIAGKLPVSSSYTQLAKDIFQSVPAAAYEVGKGALFDVAMGESADTPEEVNGVGIGTAFGILGGGMVAGQHVLSGQLIAPRAYGSRVTVPSNGFYPALDAVHQAAASVAPDGVKTRVNAIRAFVKGALPDYDFIYAGPKPAEGPDPLVSALTKMGVPEEQANTWAAQDGITSRVLGDHKVIIARDVDAAPHEAGHGIEDVLGESIMRGFDRAIQADPQYANNWDRLGQSYADALGGRPDESWQDTILRKSGWGAREAQEKLGQPAVGEGPSDPAAAQSKWAQALDAAGGDPTEAYKAVLTPGEQSEVANRYISREVAAENFDAMFKHTGGFTSEDNSIPARMARVVGGMVSYLGGEPLAGRTSEYRKFPLSYDVTKAQAEGVEGVLGNKPMIEPPTPRGLKNFGPPVTQQQKDDAQKSAQAMAAEASPTPLEPGASSPRESIATLAEAMAGGSPVQITGRAAAPGDPSSSIASNRTVRRAIIEVWRRMPDSAKSLVQKLFFPTRIIKTKGGTYQAEGWSPEVLAANAQKSAEFLSQLSEKGSPIALPAGVELDPATKSFTPDSWKLIFDQLDKFAANQRAGRTGAGGPLVVPKEVTESGGYAPPVRGEVSPVPQDMADFLNYLYNFKLPDTALIRKGTPANIQAQRVSEATMPGRVSEPVTPRGVFGEYGKTEATRAKQRAAAELLGISGTPVAEVNPFRKTVEQAAAATGIPAPSLFEAIQHLNVEGIKSVEHAPEQGTPNIPANTATLTAGFQPPRVNDEPAEHLILPEGIKGSTVSKPQPLYHIASAEEGNPWVRRSADPTRSSATDNSGRTLLVQVSSDLINPEALAGNKDQATQYYDKLYSGARPGYARMQDFWEIPQWIGFASHFVPDADVYVVRDVATAKKFLNEAGYGRVAFSALDTNKALIRDLVTDYPGKVDIGGYVDPKTFSDLPNVKWHDSMESLANDMGLPYKNGVDYRHFQGSDVIPRLTMSQGCRHKCAFCSVSKKVTETPSATIVQQADQIAKLGSKLVYLNDKTFGQASNYKQLSDLNQQILAQNPDFKGFIVQTTAAQLKTMPADWLAKSGIKFVELGIESYNDPILKAMHKPATTSMIDQVTQKLRDNHIALIPNIIIGYPGETPETYKATLDYLKSNKDIISHANIYNLALYKDAELGKQIATGADADFNENVLEKSFHTNPEVHRQFAGDVYGLAQSMLEGSPESAQFQAPREGVEKLDDMPDSMEKIFPKSLPNFQFQPNKDPRAVRTAAVRDPETGRIFEGAMHYNALTKAMNEGGIAGPDLVKLDHGFLTNENEYLTRQEAWERAKELNQLGKGSLERDGKQYAGFDSGLVSEDLPKPAPAEVVPEVQKLLDNVYNLTPEQWSAMVKSPEARGGSSYAHRTGMAAKSTADLAALREAHGVTSELGRQSLQNKDPMGAMNFGVKAQALREAYEAATGKTMDGTQDVSGTIRALHDPNYQPPVTGQYQVAPEVRELVDRMNSTSPEEWSDWAHAGGGMSFAAHTAGTKARSAADLDALRTAYAIHSRIAEKALAADDIDLASVAGNKAQAANEAIMGATGRDIKGRDVTSTLRQVHDKNFQPPLSATTDRQASAQFQAQTDAGKKLEEDGHTFTEHNYSGGHLIVVSKGKKQIGVIESSPVDDTTARVMGVKVTPSAQGKGIAETLYRELATRLQAEGKTSLTGDVIHPAPLKIREKLFGAATPAGRELTTAYGGYAQPVTSPINPEAQFSAPKRDYEGEQVTHAAVRLPSGRVFKARAPLGGSDRRNAVHGSAFLRASESGDDTSSWEEGFVTTKRPFVDRATGYRIAIKSGQFSREEYDRAEREEMGPRGESQGLGDNPDLETLSARRAVQMRRDAIARGISLDSQAQAPKTYIIRHGSTSMNADDPAKDKIRGFVNVPLSEDGKKEAQQTADQLKSSGITTLVTSDLKRARQTADAIAKTTGATVVENPGFRPWHLGPTIEGKPTKEMLPVIAGYTEKPDKVPPGGESFNNFKDRFLGAFHDTQEKYPDENVGIVTHYRGSKLMDAWRDTGTDNDTINPELFEKYSPDTKPGSFDVVDKEGAEIKPEKEGFLGRVRREIGEMAGTVAGIEPGIQFQPSANPRAIKWPAVRYEDDRGHVWEYAAPRHAEAEKKLVEALGYTPHYNRVEDGFVTNSGDFLDREAAYRRAIETKQYSPRTRDRGSLIAEETSGMAPREDVQFTPKRATDKDWKLKLGANGFSKAWITPEGKPIQLGGTFHDVWLNQNPDVKKQHGIPEDVTEETPVRQAALKAGFARINYSVNNGGLIVEARSKDWPKLAPAVRQFVQANAGKIDNMTVDLLDNKADRSIDSDFAPLFQFSDKEKMNHLPLISPPSPTTEMSPQASSAQYQAPKLFPEPAFDEELEKIRSGATGGQSFTPAGAVWKAPADSKIDLVSLASKNIPLGDLDRETVSKALKNYADLLDEPNVVAGLYAFSKDGKPMVSVDINAAVSKKHRDNTLAFAKANDQVAIWDVEHNKEVPAGGKGDTRLQTPGEILDAINDLSKGNPVDVDNIIKENRTTGRPEEMGLPGIGGKRALSPSQMSNMTKADIAEYYPESVIPRARTDAVPSEITKSPLYRDSDNPAQSFGRKLAEFAKEWRDHPSFQSGARWYSEFTPKLKEIFKDDAPIMAELLAGTSPQQPPTQNYAMALDALQGFKQGRFAKQIAKFEEGLEKLKDGSWKRWLDREIKGEKVKNAPETPTAETFVNHWVAKHNLLPRQSNGKRYSISSDAVLKILARKWMGETAGLKTQNFVKNLLGVGKEATIDLWADRTMRRIGYAGHKERWRILPKNATGVSDEDFLFSQKAFRAAAEELGMEPSELQGALWFAEKQLWADNGWGRLDLGDFRKEIAKTDMLKKGIEQRTRLAKGEAKAKTQEQPELIMPTVEPRNLRP